MHRRSWRVAETGQTAGLMTEDVGESERVRRVRPGSLLGIHLVFSVQDRRRYGRQRLEANSKTHNQELAP